MSDRDRWNHLVLFDRDGSDDSVTGRRLEPKNLPTSEPA